MPRVANFWTMSAREWAADAANGAAVMAQNAMKLCLVMRKQFAR
jgi:hypothetical protein